MQYIESITEAIGNTPLLKLNRVAREVEANVFVKLEYLNPSGSYKDRMALAMIEAAENGDTWNNRKLEPGGTVFEASAGNTAPAVAMVSASKGYKATLFLYRYSLKGGNDARAKITAAYGPTVCISSEPEKYISNGQVLDYYYRLDKDMPHIVAAKKDCDLAEEENEGSVWLDQIYNKYNYIGQTSIGREIYAQLSGHVDAVGCSVSSGASLYGMCLGLKENGVRPEIVFGVVPEGSEEYISLDKPESDKGEYEIKTVDRELANKMGLKKWTQMDSIVEKLVADGYPDKFFLVTDEEARNMADRLCREEGIYCGMSSGANVAVAIKIAERLGKGKNVVTLIVDRRDRYLSEFPNDKYVV